MLPFPRRFSRARQGGDISCALAARRSSAFPPRGTPSGFRSLHKKLAVICHARRANLFSVPPGKAELGLGSRHPLL
jgi:hypothetical protein